MQFIAAENLSDVAELLHVIDDGAFKETVLRKVTAGARHIFFDAARANPDVAFAVFSSGSESRRRQKQGAKAIPIAIAGGAGDDVVQSGEDVVDRFDVVGLGGWNLAREILRRFWSCLLLLRGWRRSRSLPSGVKLQAASAVASTRSLYLMAYPPSEFRMCCF